MSDFGRWVIPSSWKWAEASEFANVVGGGTPKNSKDPENYTRNGFPWITPADLSGYCETHIERGKRDLSEKGFASCSARLLPEGTVLLSSRAPVGYCVIASNAICTNQGFKSLVLASKDFVPEYFRYYLLGSKRYLESAASGTTFLELSGSRTEHLLFPIAPPAEQKRIVSKIDELFSRIDEGERALERVQRLVERYRQSVLKAAVTGELTREWREKHSGKIESGESLLARILKTRREAWERSELAKMKAKGQKPTNDLWKRKYQDPISPDTTQLPELPTGWVWASPVQLEALVPNALTIGPFGSNLKVSDYKATGVPLIFVRNIRTGRFSGPGTKFVTPQKANELSSHVARAGDVLITKMGDPPGDACRYPLDAPDAVITADCIKWTMSDLISKPSYLVSFINSHFGRTQIIRLTKGVAQQKVSLDRFRQIAIALPGPEEQAEIEDLVRIEMQRIDSMHLAIGNEVFRICATRQSVLRAAFAGELATQKSTDEPASALLERIAVERAKTEKSTASARGFRKKVTK